MSDVKELKSIELSSFTRMNTGIAVLFSIISAILLSIVIVATNTNAASVVIYLIPTVIVGTFMYSIYNSFCQGLIYNVLAKRLKTIAVIIKDGKEIVKISTTETATMTGIILTIQFILIYLVSVFILPLLFNLSDSDTNVHRSKHIGLRNLPVTWNPKPTYNNLNVDIRYIHHNIRVCPDWNSHLQFPCKIR